MLSISSVHVCLQASNILKLSKARVVNMIHCRAHDTSTSNSYLCTAPFGRCLSRADCAPVILTALIAAIDCVGSLERLQPPWVHRDISLGNLIVTCDHGVTETSGWSTHLLDWATAQKMVPGQKDVEPQQLTGTLAFMAMSVLQGLPHSVSSDLESIALIAVFLAADTHVPWALMRTPQAVLDSKELHLTRQGRWSLLFDQMQPSLLKEAAQALRQLFWADNKCPDGYNTKVSPKKIRGILKDLLP